METVKAYAKVNLTLDVLRKRADGYHDLRSIMHGIDLYETVTLEPANSIAVSCDVPLPDNSATYRAARAYMALTGLGAHIEIKKFIPDEAGLGAASANAAAVFLGMQKLYGALSTERLYALAAMIGADVPFCMTQGCALAEGIGDKLTALKRIPLDLLIVKAAKGISTKELFSSLKLPVKHPSTRAALRAVEHGDARALAKHMYNALEDCATAFVPEIRSLKERLLAQGALGATMTGSGSAVVGVFENAAAARAAAKGFSDCEFVRACRTI
ncbi:MAG: 4-(cytidine 5'-diphospho)-2-C-methyl-D-erythritol kinase [Eubacteriales bacterium]|nr:4-(cytidine 5'-diphospho)-2-C-methyl-D-erythritol kinase [Eubacteriales bacterium]